MHLIVTGEVGTGKTTWCRRYSSWLKTQGVSIGGILCPPLFTAELKRGYEVQGLQSGGRSTMGCIIKLADFKGEKTGKYRISTGGLRFASEAIAQAIDGKEAVVFIDELGRLEIKGKGLFAAALSAYNNALNTVTVIRKSLLDDFLKMFASVIPDAKFTVLDVNTNGATPQSFPELRGLTLNNRIEPIREATLTEAASKKVEAKCQQS